MHPPSCQKRKSEEWFRISSRSAAENGSNSILKIGKRHSCRDTGAPVRKRKVANAVNDLACGDGELALPQAKNGLITGTLLEKHDGVLTVLERRHSRNTEFDIANPAADRRNLNISGGLTLDGFVYL